jgi:hypothetical protein
MKHRRALIAFAVSMCAIGAACTSSSTSHTAVTIGTSPVPTFTTATGSTRPTPAATDQATTSPTTVAAPTTALPTLTSRPSTPPPTTSTTPALTPDEAKVKADFDADYTTLNQCFYEPGACDYESFTISGSEMETTTRSAVESELENNLRAEKGSGSVSTKVESVSVSAGSAAVIACTYDDAILFDTRGTPSPTDDIIFNDDKKSYRATWNLVLVGRRWLIQSAYTITDSTTENLCAP